MAGGKAEFENTVDHNGLTRRIPTYILPHSIGPVRYDDLGKLLFRPDWGHSALHVNNVTFINAVVEAVCNLPVCSLVQHLKHCRSAKFSFRQEVTESKDEVRKKMAVYFRTMRRNYFSQTTQKGRQDKENKRNKDLLRTRKMRSKVSLRFQIPITVLGAC